MSRNRPCVCHSCGRTEAEAGGMSVSGLCAECGIGHMMESAMQIRNKSGPYYERWLAGVSHAAAKRIAALNAPHESDEPA